MIENGSFDVFVFGSNLAGRHGKGSALWALKFHGAVYGQAEGRQGKSYAIPTKNVNLRPLSLTDIGAGVEKFIDYAAEHSQERFFVVRIGCGLAGYADAEIAPMFVDAPANCILDPIWDKIHYDMLGEE